MKIVTQNYKTGALSLLEVPRPTCRPGGVVVRTHHSLISAGTELMKVRESRLSLAGKARARPDQVAKVLETVRQQGLRSTYQKVLNRLDSETPLGYSLAGKIVEVGDGLRKDLVVGQRVACAGNQYALHADFNWVPENLVAPLPDGVQTRHAAFGAVAGIALHSVRVSGASIGESACVIGLGLVGQIVVQILRASGVQVFGVDPVEARRRLSEESGAIRTGSGEEDHAFTAQTLALTQGKGCDVVIVAASSTGSEPMELAAQMARDRGVVVVVGKCGLDLSWKTFYEKELDLRMSRSYGPGRYDPTYEEEGVDYPIGYVRWTEGRNIQAVMQLLDRGVLDFEPLVSHVFPFDQAPSVYGQLEAGEHDGVGVLFEYGAADGGGRVEDAATETRKGGTRTDADRSSPRQGDPPTTPRAAPTGILRIGAIGCGNFALSTLLPSVARRADVSMACVATRSALSGANARAKLGFEHVTTDHRELLARDDLDVILVLTPHASHATLVCEALETGRPVFVEKPLALDDGELGAVVRTVSRTENDRLMVGFNRRFAPLLSFLKEGWGHGAGGQTAFYRVNAGRVDSGSWYADRTSQGSRFVGEGGHFVDCLSWWFGEDPVEVSAVAVGGNPDSLVATFTYPNGATGVVAYISDADPRFPKEQFEAFQPGAAARLGNFRSAEIWRQGRRQRQRAWRGVDKGHAAEMSSFLDACRDGGPLPISFASLVATTQATIAAHRSALLGHSLRISTLSNDDGPNRGAGE